MTDLITGKVRRRLKARSKLEEHVHGPFRTHIECSHYASQLIAGCAGYENYRDFADTHQFHMSDRAIDDLLISIINHGVPGLLIYWHKRPR